MNLRKLLAPAFGAIVLAGVMDVAAAAAPGSRGGNAGPRPTMPRRAGGPATLPPGTGTTAPKPPINSKRPKPPAGFIGGTDDGNSI